MKPIRVLVVDDSAVMRKFLRETLSSDPSLEVVGAAQDPLIARDKIRRLDPDVLTLDIMMPKMDGMEFLRRLMRLRPTPVIVFSNVARECSEQALAAMAMGAVDFVSKPHHDCREAWDEVGFHLRERIKGIAMARPKAFSAIAEEAALPSNSQLNGWPKNRIVAIGASTGGVQAIRAILSRLPVECPPILIAQHMPANFTTSFARRLDSISEISVCEASDGCPILPGHAYVAPGSRHLTLSRVGGRYVCALEDGATVNGHVPSVDVLFRSLAKVAPKEAQGILLTGMGRDGAQGLKQLREAGGVTIAQDHASSLIFGMPKAAIDIGAAQYCLPLESIGHAILETAPPLVGHRLLATSDVA